MNLTMNIAYRTLDKLAKTLEGNIQPEALLHSAQGFYHTQNFVFTRKMGLKQDVQKRKSFR